MDGLFCLYSEMPPAWSKKRTVAICAQSGENGGQANLLPARLELHWRNKGSLPYFLRTKSKVVDCVLPMHFLEGANNGIHRPGLSPDWAQ